MSTRIVLASLGSLGDLHPFISVAVALKARGFMPVIAASEGYRQQVIAEGISFFAVAPALSEILKDTGFTEGDIMRNISSRFVIDKVVTPYIRRSYDDLCEAMKGASAVVACNFSMVARIAAEKHRLPVISLVLSPCVFFSAEEPAYLFEAPWLGNFRAIFGARATRLLLDMRRVKSRWRTRRIRRFRRHLGLTIPKGDELLDGTLRADQIYGLYSPKLGPLPPDAPYKAVLAGHTFYDGYPGYDGCPGRTHAPSPELEAFLAAGPAPLVFTLGSQGIHAPGSFYETAAAAAARLDKRAVLLVGAKAEAQWRHLASDTVFVAAYVPHSSIFPHAAAVIHHGGIGTVGQALRAGRVQLVCPMVGDQADNAERLVRLGIAKRLDHKHFTELDAAAALGNLLSDDAAVGRAAAIGAEVALEDGASVVASKIEAFLACSSETLPI